MALISSMCNGPLQVGQVVVIGRPSRYATKASPILCSSGCLSRMTVGNFTGSISTSPDGDLALHLSHLISRDAPRCRMPDHDLPGCNFIGDYPVAGDVTRTPLRHMNHLFPQYAGI